jgi:hypothetical protein
MADKNVNNSKKEEELEHYVEAMISRGFSEGAIIKGLRKKGWDQLTIKKVIKLAKLNKRKEKGLRKKKTETAAVKADFKKDKKKDKTQIFFFIVFLMSLGLSIYTWLQGMWIAMGSVLILLIISLVGYRLKSHQSYKEESSAQKTSMEQKYQSKKKYKEALIAEKLKRSNLREIMRKKREEEKYLKKIEKVKRREERLKNKQEMKSKGANHDLKLKKIETKNEKLKLIETKLKSELARIGEKKEILEQGKKLGPAGKDETDLDQLYDFIQKYGKIRLHEIITMFGVPKRVATQWMTILEEYELAEVYYPALGSPELRACKK